MNKLVTLAVSLVLVVAWPAAGADKRPGGNPDQNNRDNLRDAIRNHESDIERMLKDIGRLEPNIKEAAAALEKVKAEAAPYFPKLEEAEKAVVEARNQTEAARKAVGGANREVQETQSRLQADVEKSPEMRSARAACDELQAKADKRREDLLAPLRELPRHKAIVADLAAKREQRKKIVDAGAAPGGQVTSLSGDIVEGESRLGAIEAQALAPHADYQALEAERKKAVEAMLSIRGDLLKAAAGNPDLLKAKDQVKVATERLGEAQKNLAAALKAQAAVKVETNKIERKHDQVTGVARDLEKRKAVLMSEITRKRNLIRDLLK